MPYGEPLNNTAAVHSGGRALGEIGFAHPSRRRRPSGVLSPSCNNKSRAEMWARG
ncbi:hypothetical protein I551_9021 [Mycobacterium ulcerans str. Harvey]|uniref:Uncharacterized protein n=1 Tax=Mycobacterium ulcerans str. Harvey TaxID=1299332 RepID=A0ABN0R9G7_MYCUL|nr:hypothetical protein I551_9021 [Mycobacterium ulcerans str. Harvey]